MQRIGTNRVFMLPKARIVGKPLVVPYVLHWFQHKLKSQYRAMERYMSFMGMPGIFISPKVAMGVLLGQTQSL